MPAGTRYVGLYSKMHHAALDGMGGQVLMQSIMDITPVPRKVKPARAARRLPTDNFGIAELAAAGLAQNIGQTVKLAKNLPLLLRKTIQVLRPARDLAELGCRPALPLLAAIPVSLRPEGNTELSNQVSMARMSLATTVKDPLERLQAIHASAEGVKAIISDVKTILPTDFP